ncbi:MAG: hypothetical protein KC646_07215 [Candidatus Cloacimonetes bacterium]|nr:hypothetical protein [Candidatus Cloacimonadota bacterium]
MNVDINSSKFSVFKIMFVLLIFSSSSAYADLTSDQRVQDYTHFWNSYKQSYVFFDLKQKKYGLNWDSIREIYVTKLKNSKSDLELYNAITESQALLRDGHCFNSYFSRLKKLQNIYFQQIHFSLAEGHKIVVDAFPEGSNLKQQGVEIGDEVIRWNNKSIRQLAKQARKIIPASTDGQFWDYFASRLYIHNPLLGEPKSPEIEIVFKKPNGKTLKVLSKWHILNEPSKNINSVGVKAEGPLPIELEILDEYNLSYLKIKSWMNHENPQEQFEKIFKSVYQTDGLIIDLRGNSGGVTAWGVLFTNYLISKSEKYTPNNSWLEQNISKTLLKTFLYSANDAEIDEVYSSPEKMKLFIQKYFGINLTLQEIKEHLKDKTNQPLYVKQIINNTLNKQTEYNNPIYVLVDGGSYSTTDITLSILKDFNRIKIVGSPNGAGSGAPLPFILPNSQLVVHVPNGKAYPPSGSMIEGNSIRPDYFVTQSIEDLIENKDTALSVAITKIMKEIRPTQFFHKTQLKVDKLKKSVINWGEFNTPNFIDQSTFNN